MKLPRVCKRMKKVFKESVQHDMGHKEENFRACGAGRWGGVLFDKRSVSLAFYQRKHTTMVVSEQHDPSFTPLA